MVEISDSGPKLQNEEVRAFESKIDFIIPDDYREFLLANNGGLPSPDTIDISGLPGSPTDVQVFFRISGGVDSSMLLSNYKFVSETYKGHLLLPIAGDSLGNLFCLRASGENSWNIVYLEVNGRDDGRIYEVASNFGGFLSRIREWD